MKKKRVSVGIAAEDMKIGDYVAIVEPEKKPRAKIVMGRDEDGDPITSCVVVGDLFRVNAPKPPQGKNQAAVLAAIKSKHNKGDTVALTQLVKDAEKALAGKPVPMDIEWAKDGRDGQHNSKSTLHLSQSIFHA